MSKTKFEDGRTIISAEFLNKMYGGDPDATDVEQREGHVHDGLSEDGHAGKIDLSLHVQGTLDGQRIKGNSVEYSSIKSFSTADSAIPVKVTDSNGTKYFINPETIAGGSDNQIQFNDGGELAGDADLKINTGLEDGVRLDLGGTLRIKDPTSSDPKHSEFFVGNQQSGSFSYRLPLSAGTDKYLRIASSGPAGFNLEWATVVSGTGGGAPSGPTNVVQFSGTGGQFDHEAGFKREVGAYGNSIIIDGTTTDNLTFNIIGSGIKLSNEDSNYVNINPSDSQSDSRIYILPEDVGANDKVLSIKSYSSGSGSNGEDEYELQWADSLASSISSEPVDSILVVSETGGEKQISSLEGLTAAVNNGEVDVDVGTTGTNGSLKVFGKVVINKSGSDIGNAIATNSTQTTNVTYRLPNSGGSAGQYLRVANTADGESILSWSAISSGGAPTNAEYLVLSADSTLSNEKVFSVDSAHFSFTTDSDSYNLSLSSDVMLEGDNISLLNNDAGFLRDVVDDISPQLGGNLDAQNNQIENVNVLSYNNSDAMEINVTGGSLDFNSQIGSSTNVCDYNFGGEGTGGSSKPASINLAAGGAGLGYFNIQAKNGSSAEQVVKLPGSTPSSTGQVLSVSSLQNSNKQIELSWTTPASSGAPTDAEYLVLSASSELNNEVVFGVTSGDLVITTSTNSLTLSLDNAVLKTGDNISLLNNDAGYVTTSGAPVNAEYLVLSANSELDNEVVFGVTSGDLVITTSTNSLTLSLDNAVLKTGDNISLLNNDAGYVTNSGAPVNAEYLVLSANSELDNEVVFGVTSGDLVITTSTNSLTLSLDNAVLKTGDNISLLNNDAGYVTTSGAPVNAEYLVLSANSELDNEVVFGVTSGDLVITTSTNSLTLSLDNAVLKTGDNISLLNNDAGYVTTSGAPVNAEYLVLSANSELDNEVVFGVTSGDLVITTSTNSLTLSLDNAVVKTGDNVSLLNNDAGYITSAAPVGAEYVVISANGTLTDEKVLSVDTSDLVLTTSSNSATLSLSTSVVKSGDNVSDLTNDSGFVTGLKTVVVLDTPDGTVTGSNPSATWKYSLTPSTNPETMHILNSSSIGNLVGGSGKILVEVEDTSGFDNGFTFTVINDGSSSVSVTLEGGTSASYLRGPNDSSNFSASAGSSIGDGRHVSYLLRKSGSTVTIYKYSQ